MCQTPKQPPHHDHKKKVNARYLKRNVTSERNSQECNGIKAFTGICKFVQNTRVVHEFVECATWEQHQALPSRTPSQQGFSRSVHARSDMASQVQSTCTEQCEALSEGGTTLFRLIGDLPCKNADIFVLAHGLIHLFSSCTCHDSQ